MRTMQQAFNKWMDDFTNNQDAFEQMATSVIRHLREKKEGIEPSYGELCAALLASYMEGAD